MVSKLATATLRTSPDRPKVASIDGFFCRETLSGAVDAVWEFSPKANIAVDSGRGKARILIQSRETELNKNNPMIKNPRRARTLRVQRALLAAKGEMLAHR